MKISFYRKWQMPGREKSVTDVQPCAVYHAEVVEIKAANWITADGDDLMIDNEHYVCRIGA